MKKLVSLLLAFIMVISVFTVPTFAVEKDVAEVGGQPTEAQFLSTISSLQNTFVDGKYWNKYSSSDYSRTGDTPCPGYGLTTGVKCTTRGYCGDQKGKGCSCTCGYFDGAYQCMGYAFMMAYKCFGVSVRNTSYWTKSYTLGTVYAGDVIRINGDGHSIFVYKVVGSTIYYTECNASGPCRVSWGKTISYSSLSSKFSYKHHYNGNTLTGNGTPTPSFTYTSISTGKYYLKHNATGKYMNVSYGTDANKQNVDLYDGFYTAEVMNIISTSYGYKMRPECCTSRVINAWGDNPSSGANVNIYDDTSDSTQSWKFQAVSGGYIIHNAYNTSLVLDNSNGNVCINTYTGGSSQIWSLVPYHTHNYNTHSHYGSEHPHYQYLKCSCGATQVNTSKTSLRDGCDQCYPGAPVVKVRAGSDAEYVQFYWDATKNTDEYELKICDAVTGERVSYPTGITTLNYQVKLLAGDYIVYPLSIKNSLRDTDRWWTSGASVSFTVTTGEFKSSAESIVDGKRYELFNITMPWTEAKAKCEELGGHLVTITSKEEADVVNSLVAKGGRYCYWMGMTDEDGEWINVTGEPTSYSNWISGEPNNTYGVEHYAVVRNISGNNWNDVMNMYGSQYVGFICEYENNVEELDVTIKKDDSGINFIFEELDDVAYYEFFDAEDGAQVEYTSTTDNHYYLWTPIIQGKSIFTIEVRAYDSNDQLIGVSETLKLKVDITEVEEWRMYGDLDHDNRVSILDATKIQMHIAAINKFDKFEMIQADVDSDKRVSIIDATTIQRYLASFVFDSDIGKGCYCSGTLYDYTIAPRVESDWVLASSVPKDAEIVDEKWTYDLTTRTTSNSSTAPAGYSQYKDPTWEWGPYGSWSSWSKTAYTATDSRQVENKYYAAATKTVWKYSRDVSSDGKLSTYSLGYYGNKQYITLDYRLSSKGTVDGHTRYGSYDGGYGTYLQNYWWNESQATEVVTPAYYMYRYRDRSKVYIYYYHKVESKESETEILPSDTVSNVQKWVKYLEF